VNGKLIIQKNAPNNHAYDQNATGSHESGELETFILAKNDVELINGTNVIAVQGFNYTKTSTDFYLNLKFEGKISLPETEGTVTCNTPSGFYNSPFTSKLIGDTPGETMKYTLDGSDPRSSLTVLSGISPVSVRIDPSSTLGGRGLTGGFVLRASRYQEGLAPGKPTTHSYIFTNAVKA